MASGDVGAAALARIEAELAAIRRELGAVRGAQHSGCLTFQEVASDLRVSVRSVARLVRSGQLQTVKVGRAPRVLRAELERLKTPRTPAMGEGKPTLRRARVGPMDGGKVAAFLRTRPKR